jgi:hypothetical protein
MRKFLKRWPVLLTLLMAFGALGIALLCLPYRSRVTRDNCERVKKGMTKAEVCAILGRPWQDSLFDTEAPNYRELRDATLLLECREGDVAASGNLWIGDSAMMMVAFDDDNRVMAAWVVLEREPPRSWLPERVWRRLRARYGW